MYYYKSLLTQYLQRTKLQITQGGHAEFAPRDDGEVELLKFLKDKFKQRHRVSVERIISGSGLANIYEFLALTRPAQVDPKVQEEFDAAGDMKVKSTSHYFCHSVAPWVAHTLDE